MGILALVFLWLLVGFLVTIFLIWLMQEKLDGDLFFFAVVLWPVFLGASIVIWLGKDIVPAINNFLVRKK